MGVQKIKPLTDVSVLSTPVTDILVHCSQHENLGHVEHQLFRLIYATTLLPQGTMSQSENKDIFIFAARQLSLYQAAGICIATGGIDTHQPHQVIGVWGLLSFTSPDKEIM